MLKYVHFIASVSTLLFLLPDTTTSFYVPRTNLLTVNVHRVLVAPKVDTLKIYYDKNDTDINTISAINNRSYNDDEDINRKIAWARHTVLSVAASILCVPQDVFTTPPMVDPNPPVTMLERKHRDKVKSILSKGWKPLDGFTISKKQVQLIQERMNSNGTGHNPATYGEITELGVRQLIHYMKMLSNDDHNDIQKEKVSKLHFIDLGSGSGKLVVQAYLEIPHLIRVEGIELAPARHEIALQAWEKVENEAKDIRGLLKDIHRGDKLRLLDAKLNLLHGDLFQLDISTATHIYVASLCFTDEMMNLLSAKVIKEGTNLQCLATLKPFPNTFEDVSCFKEEIRYVEMSWTAPRGQGGIVYFYKRQ